MINHCTVGEMGTGAAESCEHGSTSADFSCILVNGEPDQIAFVEYLSQLESNRRQMGVQLREGDAPLMRFHDDSPNSLLKKLTITTRSSSLPSMYPNALTK